MLHWTWTRIFHQTSAFTQSYYVIDLRHHPSMTSPPMLQVTYDEVKQALGLLKEQIGDKDFEELLKSVPGKGDGRL